MFKKIKLCLKILVILISVLIIIINITLIIKSETTTNGIPDFLGYTPFIIVSGSMEPKIPVNNIIITKKIDEDKIKVGDVISYLDEDNNIVVTHRVINIKYTNGEFFYETKGDNNTMKDNNLVSYSQVQGKYLFSIPMLGKLISYVKTPKGMGVVIFYLICIYLIYDIAEREVMRNKYKARINQ